MYKTDESKKVIGIRFKIFREIIDRTQAQLASELGVVQSEINDIEAGRIFPDIAYLHYLYEEYGLNINWLMGKVGGMFNEKDPRRLSGLLFTKPPGHTGDPRYLQYMELLDLLEIPVIEESIMAALLEIKTLLKNQARAHNEKK